MESFLPHVDSGQLKAQLNKIMADVNAVASDTAISAKGTEEAGQCILDFTNFFVACAERHGSTPHAVLGQHVVANVFVFVLDRIVKPHLMAYCRAAEKHAATAIETGASPCIGITTNRRGGRQAAATTTGALSSSASCGRRDALEARRRRLRGDIIRPFIQLFQGLHSSLVAEGEPLNSQEQLQQNSNYNVVGCGSEARAEWEKSLEGGTTANRRNDSGHAISSSTQGVISPTTAMAAIGGGIDCCNAGLRESEDVFPNELTQSLSQAPLLWKNASPLNILCNHILEVLESHWLVAVVGADYAALLLEVMRWAGYARLVTPTYLVRLSSCLVGLIERVPLHNSGSGEDQQEDEDRRNGAFAVGPNLILQEVADGRVWAAAPSVDDACLYAQVLVRLYGLSQVTSAYPPSAAATSINVAGFTGDRAQSDAAYANYELGTSTSRNGGEHDARAIVRRLMNLVKVRHQHPTPDLRLEAYTVAALRQLCSRFQYDHPSVACMPVEVVKLLCDFFFLPRHTPRHDVWRLEVMQFVTAVLSYALSDVVSEELWRDLRKEVSPSDQDDDTAEADFTAADRSVGAVNVADLLEQKRELIMLLHQTVYPTMRRVFTQHRHEYSFTSRRELFSFPCSPLQDVFDFGAVILYLCSVTHATYVDFASGTAHTSLATVGRKSEARQENNGANEGDADSDAAREQQQPQRKRHRDQNKVDRDCDQGSKDEQLPARKAAWHQLHPHPVQLLCDALCNQFFQTVTSTPGTDPAYTRRRSGAAPLVLKIRTAGILTNSAAVQDVVSDKSLFLLHLFAQPCATMRCPFQVTDSLLEDVLLPLSAAFGLRMGPLLLAVIDAVVPHCSAETQQFTFALLAQRSLPARLGHTRMGKGALATTASLASTAVAAAASVREDLLSPSEPMYRVLVTLLKRRLVHGQRGSGGHLASLRGTPSGHPVYSMNAMHALDDAHVMWETHLLTSAQRVLSQLQTFEQAVARVRDDVAAACEAGRQGAARTDAFIDPAAGVVDVGAPVPPTTAAAPISRSSLTSLLTYTPLLSPSLAVLLARFMTLVQCLRLWPLTVLHGSSNDKNNVNVEQTDIFDSSGSCSRGIDFVLLTTAHGVYFYKRIPVLNRLETTAAGFVGGRGHEGNPEHSNNEYPTHATVPTGIHAFTRTAHGTRSSEGNIGDPTLSLSSLSVTSGSVADPGFPSLFSSSVFTTWLDASEMCINALLWTCRAQQQQQQTLQHSQLQLCHAAAQPERTSPFFSSTAMRYSNRKDSSRATVVVSLSGETRSGVRLYLEGVRNEMSSIAASTFHKVPAVLNSAAEGRWMLRVPAWGRRPIVADTPINCCDNQGSFSGQVEDRDNSGLPITVNEVTRPSLPRSFQAALAASVQSVVSWSMRRAQLLDSICVNATWEEISLHSSIATLGRDRSTIGVAGAVSGMDTSFAASRSSAMLVLSVQCVQFLHLLLRLRRAGLWYPPSEHTDDNTAATTTGHAAMQKNRSKPSTNEPAQKDTAEIASGGGQGTCEEQERVCRENNNKFHYSRQDPNNTNSNTTDNSNTSRITTDTTARADVHLLTSSPRLFDCPVAMLERFSVWGGGRIYYAVLWLCHYVKQQLEASALDVLSTLPLWVALRALYQDVGTVLLAPSMACVIDPRQTILQFTAAVVQTSFHRGVVPLLRWRPSSPHAREFIRIVAAALHISLDMQRIVLGVIRRTGVNAYAATTLLDVSSLRQLLLSLLTQQSLADGQSASSWSAGATNDAEDVLLSDQSPLITQKQPFLPAALPFLPAVLRLLFLLSTMPQKVNSRAVPAVDPMEVEAGSATAAAPAGRSNGVGECRTVVQVLQVLFARYRYQVGPALCGEVLGGILHDLERLCCASSSHTVRIGGNQNGGGSAITKIAKPSCRNEQPTDAVEAAASFLYTQCGRLLELWIAQLTDRHRVDMPVCTPQWQCTLLQGAFAVLVRCEPAVAEVLGRFSFEFLSESTPYVVRKHAALHVGILFRTFSARRSQVLHTLLVKAREGMLSSKPLLCSTSLLAVAEAVRAAPELRVDVTYTLLECWATRGFAQRRLVIECLTRLADGLVTDTAETATRFSTSNLIPSLSSTALFSSSLSRAPLHACLCRKHARPLLFLWLCEYRHPLVALPYVCFGYASVEEFVVAQLPVLLPLVLLLLTESNEEYSDVMGEVRPRPGEHDGVNASAGTAAGNLFQQLLHIYTEKVLLASRRAEDGGARQKGRSERATKGNSSEADSSTTDPIGDDEKQAEDVRQLAPLCLVLRYFSNVVMQLLVIAANAPVPLFGREAAELEAGAMAPLHADWARPRDRYQANNNNSGGGATTDQHWCEAAQKSLYWLEALLNTCEDAALVQASAYVWCGKYIPSTECVATDVTATAGAALLNPAVAVNSADVLVFYLRRLALWPTRRPVFDVVLAGHVDALFAHLTELHRTPAEPALLVYGTPDQLRRALTWVAERMTRLPIAQKLPTAAAAAAAPATNSLPSSPTPEASGACGITTHSKLPKEVVLVEEEIATEELATTTGPQDVHAWQVWCLRLLVPSLIVLSPYEINCSVGSRESREWTDGLFAHDTLSTFFVLGHGTFLQSLLHVVHRSCTAPTSLECVGRTTQQLSLLTDIMVRWCSSYLMGQVKPLRIVLTYLLHWLRLGESVEVRRKVCDALLHVWPVAVSSRNAHLHRTGAEEEKAGGVGRTGAVVATGMKDRERSQAVDKQLWGCAVLLARAMEPFIEVSPMIASTWNALCRSDLTLVRCEWNRRAAAYSEQNNDDDVESNNGGSNIARSRRERSKNANAAHSSSSHEVVDVDDATDIDNGNGSAAPSSADNEEESSDSNSGVAATQKTAALPPDVYTWSWSTYVVYRNSCLAPLQQKAARRSLLTLRALLLHICGCDDYEDQHVNSDKRVGATHFAHWSTLQKLTREPVNGVAAPPASFLRHVATGVDGTRGLIVRCLEVATLLSREGTQILQRKGDNKQSSQSGAIEGAAAEATAAVTTAAASLELAERMAIAVQQAVCGAITQLYRWSAAGSANESNMWTSESDVATAANCKVFMDTEKTEDQALACFQLLRSLSLCMLHSGATELLTRAVAAANEMSSYMFATVSCNRGSSGYTNSSLVVQAYGGGGDVSDEAGEEDATAEQLVAAALGRAYVQQLNTLQQLASGADAHFSELATRTLRLWSMCLGVSAERTTTTVTAVAAVNALTSFDAAVVDVTFTAYRTQTRSEGSVAKRNSDMRANCVTSLLDRLSWVMRSVSSAVSLSVDTPAWFSSLHVTHPFVWTSLKSASPLNESAFLCRFVTALANTYGLFKKSIVWAALLPLLYAELQRAGNGGYGLAGAACVEGGASLLPEFYLSSSVNGETVSVSAHMLMPLLLHVMCLRESDSQRSTRREWSELIDKYVMQQARRCPRVASLFLHALYTCHRILIRLTRQRGLKGSVAANKPSSGRNNNNSGDTNTHKVAAENNNLSDDVGVTFSWPAAFGTVPLLQDMRECYWMSDIPANSLACAAVAVGAPHLALFFMQLSGESLFGPRTGSAALCGEMSTTRSAVMLREGTGHGAPATAISSVPYSVLFPYAKIEDYLSASAAAAAAGGSNGKLAHELSVRSGGRARERQDSVRLQTQQFMRSIFAIYEAVQQQVDVDDVSGVSAMVRRLSGGNADIQCRDEATVHFDLMCPRTRVSRDTVSGAVIRRRPPLRANTEKGDVGQQSEEWVNEMRDLEEDEQSSFTVGPQSSQDYSSRDVWSAALQRAAQMLEKGLPSTAMDILLSLNTRRTDATASCATVGAAAVKVDNVSQTATTPGGLVNDNAAPWTAGHETCLRSLLSEAAWRCTRWASKPVFVPSPLLGHTQTEGGDEAAAVTTAETAGCKEKQEKFFQSVTVPRAALERLEQPPYYSASGSVHGGFYEHLLNAFLALSRQEVQLCLTHLRSAESSLRLQLSPIAIVPTVVAAEALHEVRQCAYAVLCTKQLRKTTAPGVSSSSAAPSSAFVLPSWLMQSGSNERTADSNSNNHSDDRLLGVTDFSDRVGRTSWQLRDSVRFALSQLYGSREGRYHFVIGATERALAFHNPGLAHRWLSDWEKQQRKGGEDDDAADSPDPLFALEHRRVDWTLRKAQVAYALGRWREALALLQPASMSSSTPISAGCLRPSAADQSVEGSFAMPQEPRVVQQLVLWHAELQLVPSSQLVRDPFLSRAAASDSTGACSFLLARLCHTLATDIAARLTSHEHKQLEDSVEASKRLRRELEAQLHAFTTSRAGTSTNTRGGEGGPNKPTRGAEVPPQPTAGVGVAAAVDAGQENVAAFSDEQLRLIRRRIRELAGDIKRLEDEWEVERSNYGLYRRSALNAYSRFLQFHQLGSAQLSSQRQQQQQKSNALGGSLVREEPAVTCLPQDGAENTLHAVFGFVELWLNVADVERGGSDVLSKVLDKAVERIPTAVFLPLASQLTAQLGSLQDADRLSFLVGRIARDYPMHIVWPLLALCHGHTFAKSREVNTMHTVDEAKIKAAQVLLTDLAATPAGKTTATTTKRDAGDGGSSPVLSGSSIVAEQVQHAQLLSSAYLELAFDRNATAVQTDKRYSIKSDFLLLKEAHHLSIPPPTSLYEEGRRNGGGCGAATADSAPLSLIPHVLRYRPYFTTPGGVNVPKVLLCELSDGRVARQLLKAGDDLRQDALIEQVFATANQLFSRREATRPLRIRTFTIVPLAPTAGILQWVEHTIPLGEYVTGRHNGKEEHAGAHERYFPGEPTTLDCRRQLQNAPPRSKAEVLLKLYEAFTPALHYFFLEYFNSAEAFVARQQTFTRSVAAASMVGYVVGLGDRHINNILLHQQTAEVVHIDLGIAFDQNKLLPVPELVPFRMTRNIIDGLGVCGTEGSLRPCSEAALALLREKRELLRTLFTSIMHDPLARWVIGAQTNTDVYVRGGAGAAAHGTNESLQQQLLQSSTRQVPAMRTRASNADAARTLARIDAKLRGYDGGDVLSVATHVRKLVEEAQRVENLAVMFPGWSQWV